MNLKFERFMSIYIAHKSFFLWREWVKESLHPYDILSCILLKIIYIGLIKNIEGLI
jgi:hypothetical protein